MGRRKDPPAMQAAKGHPSRRRKKVEAEIEAVAAVVAAEDVPADDPFPVPALFTRGDGYWSRAAEIWRDQAAVLKALGRRRPGYRGALARYCMWTQFLEQAAETLRKDNPDGTLTISWPMGHGATKVMPHPSFRIIEAAEPILRLLEATFGFTPRDDQFIQRAESFNASQPSLFDPGTTALRSGARDGDADQAGGDPLNLMQDTDSQPPGPRLN